MSFTNSLKKNTDTVGSLTLQYMPYIFRTVGKKYYKHSRVYRYDDLLEVAIEASLKAEKRFNPDLGTDFSTYARHYINGDLSRYILNMTKHQFDIYTQMMDYIKKYFSKYGSYPTELKICKALGMTLEKYREFLKELEPPVLISYNYVTENGREEEYGIDGNTPENSIISLDIMKLLCSLPKEQQDIIKMVCIEEMSIHNVMTYLKTDKSKAQSKIDKAISTFKELLESNGITG